MILKRRLQKNAAPEEEAAKNEKKWLPFFSPEAGVCLFLRGRVLCVLPG